MFRKLTGPVKTKYSPSDKFYRMISLEGDTPKGGSICFDQAVERHIYLHHKGFGSLVEEPN